MSKYIDLEDTLLQSCHEAHDYPFVMDVKIVLAWLDEHPDQVPGRTITESEFDELVDTLHQNWAAPEDFSGVLSDELETLGITVAPDPEPTNADKWETFIRQSDFSVKEFVGNDATQAFARVMDELGVKAPEHA